MIRVLHLLDADADFQTQRSAEHLSRDLGGGLEARLRTIGRGGDDPNTLVALAGMRREARRGFDICHAWGARALGIAAMTSGGGTLVYTPAAFPTTRSLRWLRAVMTYRPVEVICPTATLRRTCVERGVKLARCHLIRPGVDFARVKKRRSSDLRQSLGFAETDRVLLAAGESTWEAQHDQAAWAVSILHVLDAKYKVLLWGRGPRSDALANFARRLNQPRLINVAQRQLGKELSFEDLLPAADVALVTARRPAATLEVCLCMAAALPIVATVWPTTSELLEDRHTALMVAAGSPRALARRILDLEEDANLKWSISDMARTEAYEYFSLTRFLSQYRTLYAQIAAGEKVEVPEPAPGAGLRFHGRD